MNIFILHEDVNEIPKLLDDDALVKCMDDIEEVFSTAHVRDFGMHPNVYPWVAFILECQQNYDYLLSLYKACAKEYQLRFSTEIEQNDLLKKMFKIAQAKLIECLTENKLPLPLKPSTDIKRFPPYPPVTFWIVEDPFPVLDLIASYRKYYASIVAARFKEATCKGCQSCEFKCDHYIGAVPHWTHREMPDFLQEIFQTLYKRYNNE
jgi:hypothetical protein